MARTFTRIGKEIDIAVKAGGPDPANNTRLRILIQNAKAENMPKENVERAIKRAVSKDTSDYKEIVYEGYAPFGIAVVVEAATDNKYLDLPLQCTPLFLQIWWLARYHG